jgi:hypothetical protein
VRLPVWALFALSFAALLAVDEPGALAAGFSTNFSTATYNAAGNFFGGSGACVFGDPSGACATVNGYFNNGDPTPFYQEVVNINGTYYFHVLVGDPASGFAQESYTRYGASAYSTATGSGLQGAFSPDSGGNQTLNNSTVPANCCTSLATSLSNNFAWMANNSNMSNPLANETISGNGTGNPSNTVFRMVLTSPNGDMSLEVDKPFLDMKPLISQTVQDGNMTAVFVADMRGISYQDKNTPIAITNNVVINDPSIPGAGAANFTMASAQQSDVTAGRYTFTPGTGWNNPNGWDAPNSSFGVGTYSYFGAPVGYDVNAVDWTQFFNYAQNALNCTRVGLNTVNTVDGGAGTRTVMGNGGQESCPGHP